MRCSRSVALVTFNYLSMLWADSPGSALDASNLLVLYAAIAWTFAVLPWTPRALTGLFCLWSLGVAVFCVVGLAQVTSATNLDPFFIDGRFSTPMSYPNATAALAVMGMWPALILSARRELPWWLRAACLPVAVFLAEFALLPQSRAALVGLICTVVVGPIVSSDRVRLLSRMVVVGGALAISVPRTVAVDDAVSAGRRAAPVLRHAANGMLLTSIAALVIGLLLAWLDPKWGWRPGRARARADGRSGRGITANGAADKVDGGAPGRRARPSRRGRLAVVGVLAIVVVGGVVVAAPRPSTSPRASSRRGTPTRRPARRGCSRRRPRSASTMRGLR